MIRISMLYTLLVMTAIAFGCLSPLHAGEEEDQLALAERFILSYFLQDTVAMRECLPQQASLLFSPYPLAEAPHFFQPRVKRSQALMEFTALMKDEKYPHKGGVLLYRDQEKGWRVRNVLFYNHIPPIFGLPAKSETDDDRAQEAPVQIVVNDFFAAWQAENHAQMQALWHDWRMQEAQDSTRLTLSNFQASRDTTNWGDPYIMFSMKVTYKFSFLNFTQTVFGGILLVQEAQTWKVRGNHFIFTF